MLRRFYPADETQYDLWLADRSRRRREDPEESPTPPPDAVGFAVFGMRKSRKTQEDNR